MSTLQLLNPETHKLIKQLGALTDNANVYWFGETPFSRKNADGLITFLVETPFEKYGIIYNDFKVNGGSFGNAPSKRTKKFINYLESHSYPLIFMTNTIGARLMEGRNVFQHAFSLLPALAEFSANNLLVTANMGRSLGLGALIFSMGKIQLSLKKDCAINLTGPEVIKMFFGKGHPFAEISCVKKHQKESALVHEIYDSKAELLDNLYRFMHFTFKQRKFKNIPKDPFPLYEKMKCPTKKVDAIIANISEKSFELYSQLDDVVRVFICERNGELVGVFINPPGRPNNIISIKTLEKYQAALDLFSTLKLPIISFLDTPGASPLNFVDSKKEVILLLRDTAQKIIDYPHGKMGFCIERAFGGATVLGLPKVFGAHFQFIIKGAQVGIMHHSIIERLLAKSERLLAQWIKTRANEPEDYSDLIEHGTIDGVITPSEINNKIDYFQDICAKRDKMVNDIEQNLAKSNQKPSKRTSPEDAPNVISLQDFR